MDNSTGPKDSPLTDIPWRKLSSGDVLGLDLLVLPGSVLVVGTGPSMVQRFSTSSARA